MESRKKEIPDVEEILLSEEETKEEMKKTCLMSDIVMNYAFNGNTELTQFLLRILLEREDIKVVRVRTQEQISLMDSDAHFIILDIHAVDTEDTHYDIEMQRIHTKDLPQRGTVYAGHLLSRYYRKGRKDYTKIPKVYVLFLIDDCKFPQDKLYVRYHTTMDETNEEMDRSPETYLFNMKYRGEKTQFMDLFADIGECEDEKIRYGEVKEIMVQYHQINGGGNDMINHPLENATRRGVEYGMKVGMEKGMEKGMKKGVEKGKIEANEQFCLTLLRDGLYSEEKIAELLHMPLSEVQKLKKEMQD